MEQREMDQSLPRPRGQRQQALPHKDEHNNNAPQSSCTSTTPPNPLWMERKKLKRKNWRIRARFGGYHYSFLWCLAWAITPPWVRAAAASNVYDEEAYPASHGMVSVDRYCAQTAILVTQARLTCDSPGAYYYGSKTYRGSEVCIDGDKVNLKLDFEIMQDLDSSTTVYIQIGAGVYNTFQQIVSPKQLCAMSIQSLNGASCPQKGEYQMKTAFYLPQLMEDSNRDFHFTPDLNITLTDGHGHRLGCARTGTAAMHRQAKRRHIIGMWSLGIALVIFGAVFGGLLVLAYRRKKRLESLTEKKVPKYQYFRTLPNGQVVPIQPPVMPPHIIPPMPPPLPHYNNMPPGPLPYNLPPGTVPEGEAYQISNPAYNETQLPTRPVI